MAAIFSECFIMNITTSLITEILARLPPNEVVRCRCVCKAWLNLLSDAEFVNLHLSKSPKGLIVHKLYSGHDYLSIRLIEVEDEIDHHGVRYIAGMDKKIPRRGHMGMTMIGSINGLVCINDFANQYDLINIWNPVIGELITVQTPQRKQRSPNVTTYGFGVISSGKYQVVRIFQEIEITCSETNSKRILQSTCHVYTIGAAGGFWKNIGHAPYLYSSKEQGLFFNGNLHWITYDENDPEQICSFDLEKESFQPFPPPPELCQRDLATLNLYKGCISLCDYTPDFNMVIWVMKEYGVRNSWRKEMVIDLAGHCYEAAHIIKVFEDGEILLLWRNEKLSSYHPKRKTVQNVDVKESKSMAAGPSNQIRSQSYHCIEAAEYVSSIVSLKNLGETNYVMSFPPKGKKSCNF